eukprot:TRINITY_DN27215_c0_g1_i1.p1 TRINITY_DN27215_c0_g1~~TRINITY_DN27215_c0_g1_i1.p1  ORF type:complete len:983 (-),score=107.77 TRINITY_DN27215_c0_g1_i1:41-2947(-)
MATIVALRRSAELPIYFVGCSDPRDEIFQNAHHIMEDELSKQSCAAPEFNCARSVTSEHAIMKMVPDRAIFKSFDFFKEVTVQCEGSQVLVAVGLGTNKQKQERAAKLALALALAARAGRFSEFCSQHQLRDCQWVSQTDDPNAASESSLHVQRPASPAEVAGSHGPMPTARPPARLPARSPDTSAEVAGSRGATASAAVIEVADDESSSAVSSRARPAEASSAGHGYGYGYGGGKGRARSPQSVSLSAARRRRSRTRSSRRALRSRSHGRSRRARSRVSRRGGQRRSGRNPSRAALRGSQRRSRRTSSRSLPRGPQRSERSALAEPSPPAVQSRSSPPRKRHKDASVAFSSVDELSANCEDMMLKCSEQQWFQDVCKPSGDSVMKAMQWKGDAVLGLLARTKVHQKSSELNKTNQADMARWAQLSVSNSSLIVLYDKARVQRLFQGVALRGKQKADCMEAIIFKLYELKGDWMSSATGLARDALDAILEALLAIGKTAKNSSGSASSVSSGARADDIRTWLKQYECSFEDRYTHSSLFGGKDWTTQTGRLCFPDVPEIRSQFEAHIATMYRLERPLCYVEMATTHYPFYEDIDIMYSGGDGSRNKVLSKQFWLLRAHVLLELFPWLNAPLELTLFQAHGFQAEKQCQKESYHAVWRNLVVDKGRAHAIRLATIEAFNLESRPGGKVEELRNVLLKADDRNTWEAVFDIASVRGGSFRMPFCGKVHKGRIERPILPEAVWTFTKRNDSIVQTAEHSYGGRSDLSDQEWLRRGGVRLVPTATGELPALTPWKPAKLAAPKKVAKKSVASSSSMGSWRDRQAAKEKNINHKWEEEQRLRRRLWKGTGEEFKSRLDKLMDDEAGYESMWIEIKAKVGCRRWSWSHRRLKGVIEFESPSGEVFLRGSKENQVYLLELVKEFTKEYEGKVPKMSAATKRRLLPKKRPMWRPTVRSWHKSSADKSRSSRWKGRW